jgi:hypothetical protein
VLSVAAIVPLAALLSSATESDQARADDTRIQLNARYYYY